MSEYLVRAELDTLQARPGRVLPLAALRGDLTRISAVCHPFFCTEGLGPALSNITGGSQPGAEEAVLTKMARRPLTAVMEGCLAGDLARVALAGRKLIGLGPGLTPAGDDFLGGLFFAAWWLEATYPWAFVFDWRAVGDLLAWAGPRTNRISHALLADLARGDGPAPLHDLLGLFLTGGARTRFPGRPKQWPPSVIPRAVICWPGSLTGMSGG